MDPEPTKNCYELSTLGIYQNKIHAKTWAVSASAVVYVIEGKNRFMQLRNSWFLEVLIQSIVKKCQT